MALAGSNLTCIVVFLQKFRTRYVCLPQLHQLFNIFALQNRIHTHAHLEHVSGIKSFKDQ